jgi:hypothetical protein
VNFFDIYIISKFKINGLKFIIQIPILFSISSPPFLCIRNKYSKKVRTTSVCLAHLAHDAMSSPSSNQTPYATAPRRASSHVTVPHLTTSEGKTEALNDAHSVPIVSLHEPFSSPPLRAYKRHHNSAASRRTHSYSHCLSTPSAHIRHSASASYHR